MRRTLLAMLGIAVLFSSVATEAQSKHSKSKKKKDAAVAEDNSAAPDRILYDRAIVDIKKGRHEVGRLNLQTLINTYPDSEYLAKAKLAIADSYYKEGGSANLTQAVAGYKDFIVFFPFLPEAPYAQIQVAMTHYKQLEKPDRDRTEAKAAEEEFQTFLAKYPKDPLVPKAEQHLRDVQEVLAEGDFRIGYYYYVKGDKRASAGRLLSITKRYPLYSRSDEALWMLGDIFEKSEKKEVASIYYSRIVKEYPLSPRVDDAKGKLVAFHVPSSRVGTPQMEPGTDTTSVADVLTGGGKTQIGAGGGSSTPGNTAVVEIATPGTGANGGSTVERGDTGGGTPAATGDANANTDAPAAANPPPADANASAAPGATGSGSDASANPANGSATDPNAKPANDSTTDPKKESTSKKKKGLKKIIPW